MPRSAALSFLRRFAYHWCCVMVATMLRGLPLCPCVPSESEPVDMKTHLPAPRWPASAAIAILLTPSIAVAAGSRSANLVVNPSFERGDTRPAAWLFNSGNVHFGALRIDRAGRRDERCARLDSFSSHYAQFVAQDVRVRTPGRYRAGGWVRLDGGYVTLRVIAQNAKGGSSLHMTRRLRSRPACHTVPCPATTPTPRTRQGAASGSATSHIHAARKTHL